MKIVFMKEEFCGLNDNWKSGLTVQTEIFVTSQTREFVLWYNMS